jgi:anti-anti-sigma factor
MSFTDKPLKIISRITPHHITMIVRGEVDLATAPQLSHEIADRLSHCPDVTLHLDLSGVPFFDSSGLHVLLAGQRTARLLGGELILTGTSPQVDLLLEVTGAQFPSAPAPARAAATG